MFTFAERAGQARTLRECGREGTTISHHVLALCMHPTFMQSPCQLHQAGE
jgi:hypothetical protein